MTAVGVHPDTDVIGDVTEAGSGAVAGGSVAGVAVEVERLASELDGLAARLAVVVRDGGVDGRPGWSALEVMAAAGHLLHVTDVIGSLSLAQMTVTSAHVDEGCRNASVWAQRQAGLSAGDASVYRRIGRCLERYPRVAAAFVEGRLVAFHLCAIDTIIPARYRGPDLAAAIDLIADVQGELIDVAAQCRSEREFRRFCARVRDRLDPDGTPPSDGGGASELHLRQLPSGRWTLFGDLTADDGAIWATLLEERIARDLRAHRDHDDANTPHGEGTAGDTHNSQRDGSTGTAVGTEAADEDEDGDRGNEDSDRGDDAEPQRRPDPAVRRADAARSLLLDGAGATRPGRVGLYLHADLVDLEHRGADITGPGGKAHTEANYDLSDDTLWGLLAGADVTPIITHQGTPLTYGRTRRLAPPILRRVLAHRDLDCFFPGCDVPPPWHEGHHVEHWDDGGTTDPPNVWGACGHHHHLHHDSGWGIDPPDDGAPGEAVVTRPDGTIYDPEPAWQRRQRQRDPICQHARTRLDQLAADFNR
jgi:hypothetical protein